MAFNDELKVYASEGRVQPHCLIGEFHLALSDESGLLSGEKLDAKIRKTYDEELANRIVGKQYHERFDDDPNIWTQNDDPVEIDAGFFIMSQYLDWEFGKLKATSIDGHGDIFQLFFWDQAEYLGTSLRRPSYDAEMSGLKFDFSDIELLLPSATLQQSFSFAPATNLRQTQIGRPARWDWEGAMVAVIAEAQRPDGLPTGHGAQARIEEMIAAWFTRQTGDSPAPSQVRLRAAKIMSLLQTPESPEKN